MAFCFRYRSSGKCLTFLLLMIIVSYLGLNWLHQEPRIVHQFYEKAKVRDVWKRTMCSLPKLKYPINPVTSVDVACQRRTPTKDSCEVVKELFLSKKSEKCPPPQNSFCEIQKLSSDEYSVKCATDLCMGKYELGRVKKETGNLDWTLLKDSVLLEKEVANVINGKSDFAEVGFVMVRCPIENDPESFIGELDNAQILTFPIRKGVKMKPKVGQSNININILFIDSLSRHHFFRSLPKTVETLSLFNQDSGHQTTVLDFKLFQAMKSRTFENLQALLVGEINMTVIPFGIHDMPNEALHVENLFQPLRKAGYRTLWVEDLCWHWEWGLPKNLLVYKKGLSKEKLWKRYLDALHHGGIDDVGVTVASCLFLDYFEKKDPFYGPELMCFNQEFVHNYYLNYLRQQQEFYQDHSQPYFTMFMSSLGHEPTGRRIQTIDTALSSYLQFASHQSNTLTILLADHGNTYGQYLQRTSEAQVEMFHPMLFMIVPNSVRKQLGESKMDALISNQNKLISMIDIHQTIKTLSDVKIQSSKRFTDSKLSRQYDIPNSGLLEPISSNRTCSSLPLLTPNLCICLGYAQEMPNNTYYAVFADYALGQLNNEIQQQFVQSASTNSVSSFGNCQRLVATWFDKVRVKHYPNDKLEVELNLYIPNIERGVTEVFVVVVQAYSNSAEPIALLSFERLSIYGVYRKCADKTVDVSLCVCSLANEGNTEYVEKGLTMEDLQQDVLQTESVLSQVEHNDRPLCLYIIYRPTDTGVNFLLASLCKTEVYKVEFHVRSTNTMSSVSKWPLLVNIRPGSFIHLSAHVQALSHQTWDWSFALKILT